MQKVETLDNAYSEVYSILNLLGNEYIQKIPSKLYEEFKNKRNVSYTPEYSEEILNSQLNISRKALTILSALNIQYWESDPEKIDLLNKIYENNGRIAQIDKSKQFSSDIFANKKNKTQNNSDKPEENAELIVKKEESTIVKILYTFFKKIKNIFKK